jgi:hypothetical protein
LECQQFGQKPERTFIGLANESGNIMDIMHRLSRAREGWRRHGTGVIAATSAYDPVQIARNVVLFGAGLIFSGGTGRNRWADFSTSACEIG